MTDTSSAPDALITSVTEPDTQSDSAESVIVAAMPTTVAEKNEAVEPARIELAVEPARIELADQVEDIEMKTWHQLENYREWRRMVYCSLNYKDQIIEYSTVIELLTKTRKKALRRMGLRGSAWRMRRELIRSRNIAIAGYRSLKDRL